jgi:hypothetical protein
VRLEGTLDAFSLPDIFQLLSYTKKTGTLHLRREGQHGVVHLRDGSVTGGRGDASCQALGRRLVGAGLVDDETLASAVELVMEHPGAGLAKTLADSGSLDREQLAALASEQAIDAVFELLRWPAGEFAFVVDEGDPDDLGAALSVEEVVAEGRRRLETWTVLVEKVPSLTAVVALAPAPASDPVLSRDEWALLSFVDGSRSVSELVSLSGTGEYVVVSALAGLAERGLVAVGERPAGLSALVQRQQLLAALEGRPVDVPAAKHVALTQVVADVVPDEPVAEPVFEAEPVVEDEPLVADEPELVIMREPTPAQRKPVIPERPEPFTHSRQPEHAEEPMPALARLAASAARSATASSASAPVPTAPAASVGSVQGAHALAPDAVPAPYIDRDPSVNKSLLLRLIAGVRGL